MESWREQYLGVETIPASLTLAEIGFFFEPTERTRTFIESRRRPLTRLGLILHIGFLRMTGRPLAALERVPPAVLAFAAEHAGLPAPQIGTLRAIYRRRMTLFEHQRLAASAIAFQSAGDSTLRMLTAFLRRQAETDLVRQDLMQQARRWLYDRCYTLPGERVLERMAARAQDYVLVELKAGIEKAIGTDLTSDWMARLSGPGPIAGEALFGLVTDLRRSPVASSNRSGDRRKSVTSPALYYRLAKPLRRSRYFTASILGTCPFRLPVYVCGLRIGILAFPYQQVCNQLPARNRIGLRRPETPPVGNDGATPVFGNAQPEPPDCRSRPPITDG